MQVVVIGGGIIGLLSALELVRAGCQVTVLDQSQHGQAASWAGGGILSPLYPWRYLPAVNRLANLAPFLYSNLALELLESTGIDIEIHRCGMLIVDTQDRRDAVAWALDQPQEPPELLSDSLLHRLNPRLCAQIKQALWFKDMANVRSPHLMKALVKHLEKLGVKLIKHTRVVQWQQNNARIEAVIDHTGRVWTADQFVLASGAWSGMLAKSLNAELPVRPIKGQMILYKAPPRWLPTMIMQNGFYLIPRVDGHIVCGSTLEDTGFDDTPHAQALQQLHHQAITLVPALAQLSIKDQWAGLRPAAPNGMPYIGLMPAHENLWVNSGHFRNGIVLAPASAQLLREQMLKQRTSLPSDPYQFHERLHTSLLA